MYLKREDFGQLPDGRTGSIFTLSNNGITVKLTDFGATLVAVQTPDRHGQTTNVLLGFEQLAGYLTRHPYFGSTVGRFCNRIAGAGFTLDGQHYALAANAAPNHLHGGIRGFDKALWSVQTNEDKHSASVVFSYTSPHLEEGYPGALDVQVGYILDENQSLTIRFEASSDRPTVLNLTNHGYWNLAGADHSTVLNHSLMLAADEYLSVREGYIPTGVRASVTGTALDFRESKRIGSQMEYLGKGSPGFDHCFVVRGAFGNLRPAARLLDPDSGRVMEVQTTQPAVQLYTGNFLDKSPICGGYGVHSGLCLETQHFPDAPNQPEFPSTVLHKGERFFQETRHRFGIEV